MIKKLFYAAFAAFALVACAPEYDTDNLPIVIEYPQTEGSGYLMDPETAEPTVHTYEYKITEDGVDVKATVSKSNGDWCVGYFILSNKAIQMVLGVVSFLDYSVFYPVEANGSAYAKGNWSTGYLGQWCDGNGNGTNWSAGHIYWFYECSETYEIGVKDAMAIGINGSNAVAGETITSKNIIKGVPFNVTISVVE